MEKTSILFVVTGLLLMYSCGKKYEIPNEFYPQKAAVKGQWRQMLDTNDIEIIAQVYFSIGNKGYSVNQQTNEVYEYNADSNKVTRKAPFPGPRRSSMATAFTIGNKGYYGLGLGSKIIKSGSEVGLTPDYRTDFWEYDAAVDSWTQKKSLPIKSNTGFTSFYDAYGFGIGDTGYVGSGRYINGSILNAFFAYDQKSGNWTEKDSYDQSLLPIDKRVPYPPDFSDITMAFSIGGKGYVGDANNFWEYNPKSAKPWTLLKPVPSLPQVMKNPIMSIGAKTKGYLYGSTTNLTLVQPELIKDFWEFDPLKTPINGGWTKLTDFSGKARGACALFSLNDKIYLGFGSNLTADVLEDIWEYTPL